MTSTSRPAVLKTIVAYKLVKTPVMLALAVALTWAPARSVSIAKRVTAELSETGSLGWRLAHWLQPHLTAGTEKRAAVLAWLDGLSTLTEGLLLLSGSALGEWIVVGTLALLLPLEMAGLLRHPRPIRAAVLLLNAAVVAYLIGLRIKARR